MEALHYALNQRSAAAPAWVQQPVPRAWYARYGLRSDQARLPQEASQREALARHVGTDGDPLLEAGWTAGGTPSLRALPARGALRQRRLRHYSRCTAPGFATLRWRTTGGHPPAAVRITSPDDPEARSCTTREAPWGGSTLHRTETWDPASPDLMTQGLTTPSTTPDGPMGPAMVQDLAARGLLPGPPPLDSGSVDADVLVTAQRPYQSDVVGPPSGSDRWQQKLEPGYDVQAFVLDWATHQAPCPQGQTRVTWTPGREVSGDPVIRRRFARATCRAGPTRPVCTAAQDAPRQRTVRPRAHHEALQAARQRQGTPEFKEKYARRSGVGRSLSPGIRRFDLRQSRYVGCARTPLQQLRTATAMTIVRGIAW